MGKIKEIKHSRRESDSGKQVMIDLVIDGETIDTGNNMISSYSFWEDIATEAQRAMYQIKKDQNPKMFNFNLATMGVSDEELNRRFVKFMVDKHKTVDVELLMELIQIELDGMKLTGPDDNHPNPFMLFPIDSQLVKGLIIKVTEEYLDSKDNEEEA